MQRPVPCTSGDSVAASVRGAHGRKVFPAFVVPLERWLSRDRLLSQRAFPGADDPGKRRALETSRLKESGRVIRLDTALSVCSDARCNFGKVEGTLVSAWSSSVYTSSWH